MNLLPKTEFGTYKSSSQSYTTLIVWRSWLWFRYGHKEFKTTGFYMGDNAFDNCKFGDKDEL